MGTLNEDKCTSFIVSGSFLLRMENVSGRSCRENQSTRHRTLLRLLFPVRMQKKLLMTFGTTLVLLKFLFHADWTVFQLSSINIRSLLSKLPVLWNTRFQGTVREESGRRTRSSTAWSDSAPPSLVYVMMSNARTARGQTL